MDNDLDGFVPYVPGVRGVPRSDGLTGKPGCYTIDDKDSKKLYVGSSGNLGRRIPSNLSDLKHDKHCNNGLQAAYNNNHNFVIMVKPTNTTEEARQLEQEVVDKLLPSGKLYNAGVTDVTRPTLGTSHSEEIRLKMRGRKASEETRLKLSEAHLGKVSSDETKQKMSAARKEFYSTEEGKATHARIIEKIKDPVKCDGVTYPSLTEAAKALGVHITTISARCKSDNFPGYSKIDRST